MCLDYLHAKRLDGSLFLQQMSQDTGMTPLDIAETLQRMEMLRKKPDGKYVQLVLADAYHEFLIRFPGTK